MYLTKPLGIGALSTAQKKGMLEKEDADIILKSMTTLNKIGEQLATMEGVKAMTDVTGFGLLGHLSEMCEGSGLMAEISYEKVPVIPNLISYINKGCIPGGTKRNWDSYGHKIGQITEEQKYVLADPQTSGGLLLAVEEQAVPAFEAFMASQQMKISAFGILKSPSGSTLIEVV